MNPVIPIAFAALSLVNEPDAEPAIAVEVFGETPQVITAVDWPSVDELKFEDFTLETKDLTISNGGSRRVMLTCSIDSMPIDVIDGGTWGMEGFLDSFYFTDIRNETLTGWFTVSNASPQITSAPEGGKIVEFTDRITLTIFNHAVADTETYVLRDNQITYKLDDGGRFTLQSIRPKPDDIQSLISTLRIYYDSDEKTDTPLTASRFVATLRTLFPLPGTVSR